MRSWRALLVDGPVWVVDHLGPALERTIDAVNAFERWLWRTLLEPLWRGFWILVAAGAIVCLMTAALWIVLTLLGIPVPLPPPAPLEVDPAGHRAALATPLVPR